jgi:hypothetical protein
MYQINVKMIICFVLTFGMLNQSYAVQSSSEQVNPFNKLMDPSDGINKFSGDVAFTEPLYTLKGFNGLDISVNLKYSSNVYTNVRARNDIAPTGWLGLGWQLNYGSIICDHKNTKTSVDDEFTYVSPEGVGQKIVRNRWMKVEYYYANDYGTFRGHSGNKTGEGKTVNFTPDVNSAYTWEPNKGHSMAFFGTIHIRQAGEYTFYTKSIGSSWLKVDKNDGGGLQAVVTNNNYSRIGEHAPFGFAEKSGTVRFSQPGYYPIKVEYCRYGKPGEEANGLEVTWTRPDNSTRTMIPGYLLYPESYKPTESIYMLENDPYSRVKEERWSDGVIKGWIISKVDGTKLKYGDLDFADNRKATRYTFRCDDYVGEVTTGDPELHPYQWDLSSIRGVAGNEIKFSYYQDLANLAISADGRRPAWNSDTYNKQYTRASYLKEIAINGKGRIEFIRGKNSGEGGELKSSREYYDVKTMSSEPFGRITMYETLLLSDIKIYNVKSDILKQFHFTYQKINQSMSDKYVKSLLLTITEKNIPTTKEYKKIYTYYTDPLKAEEFTSTIIEGTKTPIYDPNFDENYNYGAIKSKSYPDGTSVVYDYTRKNIDNAKSAYFEPNVPGQYGKTRAAVGMLDDGNPFVVCAEANKTTNFNLTVFQWTGSEWRSIDLTQKLKDGIPGYSLFWNHSIYNVSANKNYFILEAPAQNTANDGKITVFNWDGREWNLTIQEKDLTFQPYIKRYGDITALENTILISYKNYYSKSLLGLVRVLNWNGVNWVETFRYFDPTYSKLNVLATATPGVLVCNMQNDNDRKWRNYIYNWNGEEWVLKRDIEEYHEDIGNNKNYGSYRIFPQLSFCGKHLVLLGTNFDSNLKPLPGPFTVGKTLNWNGKDWVMTIPWQKPHELFAEDLQLMAANGFNYSNWEVDQIGMNIMAGNDYLVATGTETKPVKFIGVHGALKIYNWDGGKWVVNENLFMPGYVDENHICAVDPKLSSHYMGIRLGYYISDVVSPIYRSIKVFNYLNETWKHKLTVHADAEGSFDLFCNGNTFSFYRPFVVDVPEWGGYKLYPSLCKTFTWKGESVKYSGWTTIRKDMHGNLDYMEDMSRIGYLTSTFGPAISEMQIANESAILGFNRIITGDDDETVWDRHHYLYKKFQDTHTKDIYAYACTQKKVKDGLTGRELIYNYNYENGAYDTRYSTAKYNKVTVTLPGNTGRVVHSFFNDLDEPVSNQKQFYATPSEQIQYKELDGIEYMTERYSSDGQLVSVDTMWYEAKHAAIWPVITYVPQLVRKSSSVNKLLTKSSYKYHGDNGLVWQSRVDNSDGKSLVTQTNYAYMTAIPKAISSIPSNSLNN